MPPDASLGPRDLWCCEYLTENEEQFSDLYACFDAAAQPYGRGIDVQTLADAYTMSGFFYALAKDKKRRTKTENDYESEEVLKAQLAEDTMENLVKALDKSVMVTLHLGKMERGIR